MTKRRRYRWNEIANAAILARGAWRLHSDFTAVTLHTLHHARRRVRAFRPTDQGRFEFARGNVASNDLGVTVFDLYVRFVPVEGDPHEQDQ